MVAVLLVCVEIELLEVDLLDRAVLPRTPVPPDRVDPPVELEKVPVGVPRVEAGLIPGAAPAWTPLRRL